MGRRIFLLEDYARGQGHGVGISSPREGFTSNASTPHSSAGSSSSSYGTSLNAAAAAAAGYSSPSNLANMTTSPSLFNSTARMGGFMSSAFTSMGHFALPPCTSQSYGGALMHHAAAK